MSIDIKASREICDAATPGPWEWEAQEVEVDDAGNEYAYTGAWVTTASVWEDGEGLWMMNDANAEFCAHARTALPAALDEIERLRAALREAARHLALHGMLTHGTRERYAALTDAEEER